MKTIAILILVGSFIGCGDESTTAIEAATSCPPSRTLTVTDGSLSCDVPTATVTCGTNDPSCLCRRLTGDATQTSCVPCALRYPCTDDCQCVADHGAGWTCTVSSQGASGNVWKGCSPPK